MAIPQKGVGSRMNGIDARPVVYVSGEPLHEKLHDPERKTMFVAKPFFPQELTKRIRELLAGSDVA